MDTNIDSTLPNPDTCIIAALCVPGGACKYKLIRDLEDNMLAREYTSNAAIDKIYSTYRQALTVSSYEMTR